MKSFSYLFGIGKGTVYLNLPEISSKEKQRDLDRIRDAGMNFVTLWPVTNPWCAQDPAAHDFSATRTTMDLCHERGLRVILQLIGQNPAWEYMPDSLFSADMMIAREEPLGLLNWPNYRHPNVDAAINRYVREAAVSLRDHPALWAWQIFNEVHGRSDDPHTEAAYREWLRTRYESIDELNRRWRRRYRSFDEILIANRQFGYSTWSSLLPQIDYEHFLSVNLEQLIARWKEVLREVDTEHPVFYDCAEHPLLEMSMTVRCDNEFGIARQADILGGSYYPKSHGNDFSERFWMMAAQFCFSRSAAEHAGKPFVITELQSHYQSLLTPGSEVATNELTGWINCGLALGARGYEIWKWRPFQSGHQVTGRGVTAQDGVPVARAKALQQLNRNLTELEPVLARSRPARPAARIVLSFRSRLFFDKLASYQQQKPRLHSDTVYGWYRALWSLGLEVSFTELETLSEEDLQTPILVCPALISLDSHQAEQLADYVARGGHLITDGRFAAIDADGDAWPHGTPADPLRAALGYRETDAITGTPALLGEARVEDTFMQQCLELDAQTEVRARFADGQPAVVANAHAQGCATHFGFFAGQAFHHTWSDAHHTFMQTIVGATDIGQPLFRKPDHLHLSHWEDDDGRFLAVANVAPQEAACTLVPTGAASPAFGAALDQGDSDEGAITVPAGGLRLVRLAIPAAATRP